MSAVIRKIDISDIPKLKTMGDCARYIGCLNAYKSLRAQTFIYEIDGEIVGFMQTEKTLASGILINYLYIKQEHRGNGMAKHFFNYVRENYLKKGLSILCYHNQELTEFYKKLGFCEGSNLRVSIYDYQSKIIDGAVKNIILLAQEIKE